MIMSFRGARSANPESRSDTNLWIPGSPFAAFAASGAPE
jgi:hypothetical protein